MVKKFKDMLPRFQDAVHERVRQTNGRTDSKRAMA